jgi:ABC-type spermidine/putrescine transport system permease subunit I
MNPRVDNQAENQLVTTISTLRTNVDALKAAQRTGARSLKTFLNQNASGYNFSTTLAPGVTSTTTITFTSSVQKYAIADLTFRVYANSLSNEIHPNMTSSSLWPNPKVVLTPPSAITPLVTTWSMKIFGVGTGGSNTFYVKLFVQSTDQGVISP